MTRILALDLGKRTTGLAFGDTEYDIIAALDAFKHHSIEELTLHLQEIIAGKKIDRLAIGLPLLLDGTEGEQAKWTKEVGKKLQAKFGLPIDWIDERFSNVQTLTKKGKKGDHAKAACALVEIAMKQRGNGSLLTDAAQSPCKGKNCIGINYTQRQNSPQIGNKFPDEIVG